MGIEAQDSGRTHVKEDRRRARSLESVWLRTILFPGLSSFWTSNSLIERSFVGPWQYLRAAIHATECSIGLPFRREDVSARLCLSGRFKKGIPRIVHCRTGDSDISSIIVEEILLIRVMVAPTLQLTVPILSPVCACKLICDSEEVSGPLLSLLFRGTSRPGRSGCSLHS